MQATPSAAELKSFESVWQAGEWVMVEQMLNDVKQVFETAGLPFFMCYGTFLGAVRHQGIIPWDDDIDLGICEAHEDLLLQLQPGLEKLGYSLRAWSIPWTHGTLDYYKLWIRSCESGNSLPYSWPFIDIFLFRKTRGENFYFDGQLKIAEHDLFPLKDYVFSGLTLPGPSTERTLADEYGPDYKTTCVSNWQNHKLETVQAVFKAPLTSLNKLGYCANVHHEDEYGLHKRPVRSDSITLEIEEEHCELVAEDGTRYLINQTLAAIWEWMDNGRSIGAMIDLICEAYHRPRIEICKDVIDAIRILHESRLIHFDCPAVLVGSDPDMP